MRSIFTSRLRRRSAVISCPFPIRPYDRSGRTVPPIPRTVAHCAGIAMIGRLPRAASTRWARSSRDSPGSISRNTTRGVWGPPAGLRCRRDRQPDITGEVAAIERPASGRHNEEGGDQSDLRQPPPSRASVVQVVKRRRQGRWLVARGHCRFVTLREWSRREFVGRPRLRRAKSIRCARPASAATTLGSLFGCRARRFRSAGGLRRWIRRHRRQHCDSIPNAPEAAQHGPSPLSPTVVT